MHSLLAVVTFVALIRPALATVVYKSQDVLFGRGHEPLKANYFLEQEIEARLDFMARGGDELAYCTLEGPGTEGDDVEPFDKNAHNVRFWRGEKNPDTGVEMSMSYCGCYGGYIISCNINGQPLNCNKVNKFEGCRHKKSKYKKQA